jgi:hypothetical protein
VARPEGVWCKTIGIGQLSGLDGALHDVADSGSGNGAVEDSTQPVDAPKDRTLLNRAS